MTLLRAENLLQFGESVWNLLLSYLSSKQEALWGTPVMDMWAAKEIGQGSGKTARENRLPNRQQEREREREREIERECVR